MHTHKIYNFLANVVEEDEDDNEELKTLNGFILYIKEWFLCVFVWSLFSLFRLSLLLLLINKVKRIILGSAYLSLIYSSQSYSSNRER